jgi:hypothetical protein
MPFVITEHPKDHIVEVTYPAEPTAGDVADYTMRIKRAMDEQKQPWCCLVDQRALKMISPKLMEKITLLNGYAQKRGMKKTARVVSSNAAMLQAMQMAEKTELHARVRSFMTREEALAWLKE